jgi:glycosyltransferase involved in cell wall biosynthesis
MDVAGPPKVSVVVCTYNHEPYIEQALASVLSQSTSFGFEVIVSEDCSTDATRDIVLRWRDAHPDGIRLLLSERNLRSNEVVARAFRAATGEYVALLDGDDYWTSPKKLQRQADFLDAHLECALFFHDAEVVDDAGRSIDARRWTPENQKTFSTLEDIWFGNFIATCSAMFRRAALPDIPAWYADFFPITDWPLYILSAEHGNIGYLPEVMGAYRLHERGLYSPLSAAEKLRATDRFYRLMNERTAYRHDAVARRAHRRFFLDWAHEHLARGEPALARLCVRLSLGYGMPRRAGDLAETLRVGLAAHTPFGRPRPVRKTEAGS